MRLINNSYAEQPIRDCNQQRVQREERMHHSHMLHPGEIDQISGIPDTHTIPSLLYLLPGEIHGRE